MKQSRKWAKRAFAAIGGALLIGAVAASPVTAVDRPGPDGDTVTLAEIQRMSSTSALGGQTTGLQSRPHGAITMGQVLTGNPNGCIGETQNPHRSGLDASVHAVTDCIYSTSSLYITTTLYRIDWWGPNPMTSQEKTVTSTTWIKVTPHSSCSNAPLRTYSGVSSHNATVAGVLYSALTSNTKSFACN